MKKIFSIVLLGIILVSFVYFYYNKTSLSGSTPSLVVQLQKDMTGVTPHFLDASKASGQVLSESENKIKNDIISILSESDDKNAEFYSQIWLQAIGSRYVVVSQPRAGSSYDEVMDSHTGKIVLIPGTSKINLFSLGRKSMLYVDTQSIHLYSLDADSPVQVVGSQLLGTETYSSGATDNANVEFVETHTATSVAITVFDTSKRVPNPSLGHGAKMNGSVRKVTLSF
jgi:hypothetical protein